MSHRIQRMNTCRLQYPIAQTRIERQTLQSSRYFLPFGNGKFIVNSIVCDSGKTAMKKGDSHSCLPYNPSKKNDKANLLQSSFSIKHQRSPAKLVESATVGTITAVAVYSTFGTHFVGNQPGILISTIQFLYLGIMVIVDFPTGTKLATTTIISNHRVNSRVVLVLACTTTQYLYSLKGMSLAFTHQEPEAFSWSFPSRRLKRAVYSPIFITALSFAAKKSNSGTDGCTEEVYKPSGKDWQ